MRVFKCFCASLWGGALICQTACSPPALAASAPDAPPSSPAISATAVVIQGDPILDQVVTVAYPEMSLQDMLLRFSKERGFGIAAAEVDWDQKIALSYKERKVRYILDHLCDEAHLVWKWHHGVATFRPKPKSAREVLESVLPPMSDDQKLESGKQYLFFNREIGNLMNLTPDQTEQWNQSGSLPFSALNDSQRKSLIAMFATYDSQELLPMMDRIELRIGMKVAIGRQPGTNGPEIHINLPGGDDLNITGPLIKVAGDISGLPTIEE
jgi:hypothetical protein